jgi:hypothetical protein
MRSGTCYILSSGISFPPIFLVDFNYGSSKHWQSHLNRVRNLKAFPRVYRDFDVQDNIGAFIPSGCHGEVHDCMLNADFRDVHVLLRINGFYLSRENAGVLAYIPSAYYPSPHVFDYRFALQLKAFLV